VGTVILVCGVLLVAATGALVASCLRLRGVIGFLLAAYLVASAEIVIVSLALSTVEALTRTALLLAVPGLVLLDPTRQRLVSLAPRRASWHPRTQRLDLPPQNARSAAPVT
jgi:hypothetical protein